MSRALFSITVGLALAMVSLGCQGDPAEDASVAAVPADDIVARGASLELDTEYVLVRSKYSCGFPMVET